METRAMSILLLFFFILRSNVFAQHSYNTTLLADSALPKVSTLEEVIISNSSPLTKMRSSQMGTEMVTALEAKYLPAILGEVDVIKILQLKPGVKNSGEGMAGFYVRGGGADQNLVTLDGIPIYNANHLLGLFSIFNNDAIRDAKLYKSAYPSRYGGRLSSVLDVVTKQGSMDSFSVSGGIGLLSSRLSVESPIQKGKSSIIVSARRTYLDLIVNTLNRINQDKKNYENIPAYHFSEINIRSDWKINSKHFIWITAYVGEDDFSLDAKDFPAKFRWGNKALSFNWKSNLNNRSSIATNVFYSGYKYNLGNWYDYNNVEIHSGINTIGANIIVSKKVSEYIRSQVGVNIMQHDMLIGDYKYSSSLSSTQAGEKNGGTEWAVFLNGEWDQNTKLAFAGGLRVSGFNTMNRIYINPEPRISARWSLDDYSSLKFGYSKMFQYLHQASISSVSLPVDIWYPTTNKTKPQFADQVSLGYSRVIGDAFFLNIEGYYKWMGNQIEFRDGADLVGNPKMENDFVYGKARARGVETYLEKKSGRTRGWIGYTLSWVNRTFNDINDGKPFRPRYDRRHDVSLVVMHKINNVFSLSFNWIYGSGSYTTLPVGRYVFQNEVGISPRSVVPVYDGRNNYQLQAVHRLDFSLVTSIKSKRGQQDITFSLYNAYSRRNPFYIKFSEVTDKEGYITSFLPKVVSLFPILPGITYNFKF